MNIEQEYPLHVAVWNNHTEKLVELIKKHKVSLVVVVVEVFEREKLLFSHEG